MFVVITDLLHSYEFYLLSQTCILVVVLHCDQSVNILAIVLQSVNHSHLMWRLRAIQQYNKICLCNGSVFTYRVVVSVSRCFSNISASS